MRLFMSHKLPAQGERKHPFAESAAWKQQLADSTISVLEGSAPIKMEVTRDFRTLQDLHLRSQLRDESGSTAFQQTA